MSRSFLRTRALLRHDNVCAVQSNSVMLICVMLSLVFIVFANVHSLCCLISLTLLAFVCRLLLSQDDDKEYSGPSPGELLDPLFKRSSCSYRVCFPVFHFYFHLISLLVSD